MGKLMNPDDYQKHPTFGAVSVNRVWSSKGISLFGSRVKHANWVKLAFYDAEFCRDLSRDWIHAGVTPVAEVYMTPVQWALLVSSFNGSPIPATFRCKRTGPLEQCGDTPEYPSDISAHEIDLDESMGEIRQTLKDLLQEYDAITQKPGKRVLQEFRGKISQAFGKVLGTLPFIGDSLKEKMHEHVNEAKAEVETFITARAQELGLSVMKGEGTMPFLGPDESGKLALEEGRNKWQ